MKVGILLDDFNNTFSKSYCLSLIEMKPQSFDIEAIPYHSMWKEARIWYPVCLSGKQFFARFYFDCSGEIERSEISEAAESEKMA